MLFCPALAFSIECKPPCHPKQDWCRPFRAWAGIEICVRLYLEDGFARVAIHHGTANLDEAHAAHADRFHFGMITKDGNVYADFAASTTILIVNRYLFSINRKRDLFCDKFAIKPIFNRISNYAFLNPRNLSIPVTTAIVENSPSGQRHLFCICLATLRRIESASVVSICASFDQMHHPIRAFAAGCAFATGIVFEEVNGFIE